MGKDGALQVFATGLADKRLCRVVFALAVTLTGPGAGVSPDSLLNCRKDPQRLGPATRGCGKSSGASEIAPSVKCIDNSYTPIYHRCIDCRHFQGQIHA